MTDSIHDLAVIGAGVMGLSAAFIAARSNPRDRIVIFERETVGAGASGFAPGIQINIGRNEKERSLFNRGSKIWRELYPDGRWPDGRNCDVFWLTRHPGELAQMNCVGDTIPSASFALTERLSSLPRFLVPDDMAVMLDRGSYCPVRSILQDLAQRLKAGGISICEGTSIERIRQGPNRILLQASDDTECSARRAILAIGPWLQGSPLRAHLADEPRLRVKKVVALHLAARPTANCPMIGLFDDYAFLIPMIEEGYWLFSFTSQEWDVRPDAGGLQVSSDDLARATAILAKWFSPDMPAVTSARVFCDCYSDDGVPFSRPAQDVAGLYVIGGGSGNGFRFGPACAEDAIGSLYSHHR
ncbi:glycine/D-amino acid oxidase-like deaminating enzyme [Bradyrhizobium sp. USDA 4524]|uniref:NAD(P)/FAD-dependent oxidoreductase n=1 Tax=unclassified Bradyrhizobium TaxID=2631580 RepID=UPI00209ECB61|nr:MULTISPECIES: FAD-dependent oxidoreductase [unclassified Bradyrhizobium]MCP1838212.1 glycine/D-amino acid oxidase-like deaminating enzyme [Bradyrhizobium sp. USDA 4538]MCP1898775.1 glycine/D-amino acid oxidase-like deaminating enzyme [Bradyrhizobium sp. USDA 4537]MCP1987113.1 glycine/D-amino acid oxidase-like deaminating enzyme [Bradyrhizobium sp. USDA 4539]